MKVLEPGPDIVWLGHDCFRLSSEKIVYIDPYELGQSTPADIILVTHNHGDHCSPADIARVSKPGSVIVAPAECQAKLSTYTVQVVKPGDTVNVQGIAIEAVPAYNLTKFRSPGHPYHPKQDGKVGYIVTIGGRRVYHTGDSDLIPEMSGISCDIALVPVSGTYVMTAQEGAEAANLLNPKMAIPMHYGAIVGSAGDAETFKRLVRVPATIMTKGE